jgi:hypothetical protein
MSQAAICLGGIQKGSTLAPAKCLRLVRARRVRLARRDQRSGRRQGPHRLRQPCRLRRAIEPQQPGGQIGVTPPQRLQQRRLGGIGEFLLHDATHNAALLTEGFGGTATMVQMINDVFTMTGSAGPDSAIVDVAGDCDARHYAEGEGPDHRRRRGGAGVVGWLAVIAVALMSAG